MAQNEMHSHTLLYFTLLYFTLLYFWEIWFDASQVFCPTLGAPPVFGYLFLLFF